jgi:serine/threonine-protein kinase
VATRAPFFTVTTLKHLMGWLYEKELKALGRAPVLPHEFLDQVFLWREASVDPRPGVEFSVETKAAPDGPTDPAQVETQPDMEGSGQPARRSEVARGERSSRSTFGGLSGRRGRMLAWAVTTAAISLGLVLVILTQRRPPPIEIHSQPLGAQVRLDGEFRGMTPVVLEDVSPDTFTSWSSHSWARSHGGARTRQARFVGRST